jgi:hypothetical protein
MARISSLLFLNPSDAMRNGVTWLSARISASRRRNASSVEMLICSKNLVTEAPAWGEGDLVWTTGSTCDEMRLSIRKMCGPRGKGDEL